VKRSTCSSRSNFEVILLDLSLPDSSGLETVNRMRAAAPEMPVVVLSSQDDEEIALQALHKGAEDYLVKERGDGELIARSVRYSIERKGAEEAVRQRERRLEELAGKLITAQEGSLGWTASRRPGRSSRSIRERAFSW
jgi:two-component system cell cycle sensor histidine kinase/response regulator CckA